jgi:hypothetical protein
MWPMSHLNLHPDLGVRLGPLQEHALQLRRQFICFSHATDKIPVEWARASGAECLVLASRPIVLGENPNGCPKKGWKERL